MFASRCSVCSLSARNPLRIAWIVRLVREVWAIPGRVKLGTQMVQRVRLCPDHQRTRDVCRGFRPLLAPSQTLALL